MPDGSRAPGAPAGLRLRAVTAGYGGAPVLRGVDLTVRPREVVGLIGPNGSGKTTLVRVASRALRPRSGSVDVAGRDPYVLSARHAARLVAVVPQDAPATLGFTALEVVLMGRSAHLSPWGGGGPEDYRRAREAMEAAGVHHLADRDVDRLSGGERQRVVLAQALCQDAPVLLLDEPTTHLDPGHVVAILEVVRTLARDRDRAVLAVFHDLNLASASCDRLVALDGGRIVADGPPDEVITRSFLHEAYGVEADVYPHAVTGRPVVVLGPPLRPFRARGLPRAHVVGGAGRGAPVMRALAEAGYEVTAGVLHATDTDAVVAERLNLERITVPPFSEIDAQAAQECVAMMRRAAVVVVCDAPYGPGNLANLEAAVRAAEEGVAVVLLEQVPARERDFTGGRATELWERLAGRARVVRSFEEVLA
ncbi:MAG TPA: ABC transporter ATP-binding protein [Actinomycetota bacterium]|nr:ABC transporter ATP-binding protein [Actinomycetota bacterium]